MLFLWDARGSREPELASRLGAVAPEDADALRQAIELEPANEAAIMALATYW